MFEFMRSNQVLLDGQWLLVLGVELTKAISDSK